jgi:tRNA pseudouridine38-40 synthase
LEQQPEGQHTQGQQGEYQQQQDRGRAIQQQQQEQQHEEEEEAPRYMYAVLLQYDGTDYAGWQLQPLSSGGLRVKPTVQLRLEAALTKATGESRRVLKVQAAGRTDAGVHAAGQVAQFACRRPREPAALLRALNSLLPPDIRALAVERVPLDFNVRYALRKTYRYDLHLDPIADPFLQRWRHHPRRPERLRLGAVEDAAQLLVGTHNFSNFGNVRDGSQGRKSPVKTVLRYQLLPIEGGARYGGGRGGGGCRGWLQRGVQGAVGQERAGQGGGG